jgi:hypothetical protein
LLVILVSYNRSLIIDVSLKNGGVGKPPEGQGVGAKETLAKETLAKETLAKETLAKETLAKAGAWSRTGVLESGGDTKLRMVPSGKGPGKMPSPMGQAAALSCLGLGHYRRRNRVQIDRSGVDQLIVDVLAETALHASDEITIIIDLLKQVA